MIRPLYGDDDYYVLTATDAAANDDGTAGSASSYADGCGSAQSAGPAAESWPGWSDVQRTGHRRAWKSPV